MSLSPVGSARAAEFVGVAVFVLGNLLAQAGLPEMVGSHEGQKVTLNRENGRDRPKQSCYYAAL